MRALLVFAFLLNPGTACAGKIYHWVDAQGNLHFSDERPPQDTPGVKRLPHYESNAQAKGAGEIRSSSGRMIKIDPQGTRRLQRCSHFQKELSRLHQRMTAPHPPEQDAYFRDFEIAIQRNIDRYCD